MIIKLPARQMVAFGVIGLFNTAIDVASYSLLIYFSAAIWPAIIISTSLGLASSFLLNRRFTFSQTTLKTRPMAIRFLIVTLVGLWVLQPAIVLGLSNILQLSDVTGLSLLKLIATVASMTWNFCWYKLYVFNTR